MRSLIRERLRNCSTNIVHQVYRQIFSLFVTWILFLTPYQIQVYVIWALRVGLNFFFFFTIVTCTHIICSKVNSPTHLFYFSLNVLKLYMRWNCLQQNETGLFYWKRRKDILIKTSHNFILNSYIKKIDNLIFFLIILCLSSNIWFIENIARYTHREGMWFLELLSPL